MEKREITIQHPEEHAEYPKMNGQQRDMNKTVIPDGYNKVSLLKYPRKLLKIVYFSAKMIEFSQIRQSCLTL